MNQIIYDAIKHMKILGFNYHGFSRVVEPHAYGVNKNGNHVLRAYQIKGGSVSGDVIDWKLFNVSEISQLTPTQHLFLSTRAGYERDDKGMIQIFSQL
jgi:hypothetical protein